MSDRRYRDDWRDRSPPRRRSRSPPRPFKRPGTQAPVSYEAYRPEHGRDYGRGSTSNDRRADSPNNNSSSRVSSVSSPTSHRGGGTSPRDFRNQDPRGPTRIDTNQPRDPRLNATASASAVESSKESIRVSVPGQKNPNPTAPPDSVAVDPPRGSTNGAMGDKNSVENPAQGFEALFKQLFENLNSTVPLMMQKEKARERRDRETRESGRHNALLTFPSAKEQFEEEKRSSAESFDQIDAELKQHIQIRDQATRKLGSHLSSMIPSTLSRPNGLGETVPVSELQPIRDSISSLERSSSRNFDKEMSDLKREQTDIDERLTRCFDHVNTTRQLAEGHTKEVKLLKEQHAEINAKVINHRTRLDGVSPHFRNIEQSINEVKASLALLRAEKMNINTDWTTKFVEEQERRKELGKNVDETLTQFAEQQRRREELEQRLNETATNFGQVTERLRSGLDEVNVEVKKTQEAVGQRNERLSSHEQQLQASSRPQSRTPGDAEFGNRLAKVETAAMSLKQEFEIMDQYQKAKEEVLDEEMEKLKAINSELEPKIHQAQTEIRQAQTDISQVHTRLNKTSDRVGHVERASASAQSSKNASPHPQTPQSETPITTMTDFQKQFIKTSNIVIELQRQVAQHMQIVAAHSHAFQALESRYNNLTTEPLIKAMVQNMQEMYPYASNTQREIEALKAELLALKEKCSRPPPEFQIYENQTSKVEKDLRELSSKAEREEARLTQAESKRLENWLRWEEERQDLVQRIEEMKKCLDDTHDQMAEPIADLSARVERVEKDMHLGRFADNISSEAGLDQDQLEEVVVDEADDRRNVVNGHGGRELFPGRTENATVDTKRRSETSRSSNLESRITRPSDGDAGSPKLGKKRFLTHKKRKRSGDGDELGSS